MRPRFTHDCDGCRFLGQFERFDLYFCQKCDGGSVIARYGDEGDEYASAPHFIDSPIEPLREAWRRVPPLALGEWPCS